jgi:hypothetical protein
VPESGFPQGKVRTTEYRFRNPKKVLPLVTQHEEGICLSRLWVSAETIGISCIRSCAQSCFLATVVDALLVFENIFKDESTLKGQQRVARVSSAV